MTVRNITVHAEENTDLQEIALRYSSARNYFFSRYSGPKSLKLLDHHRQDIRDVLVKTDLCRQWGLPARYWKLALDDAVGGIKSLWSNAGNKARKALRNNEHVTDEERHYLYSIMRKKELLSAVLCGTKELQETKAVIRSERVPYLHNLLRRYYRRYRGSIPVSRKKTSFKADSGLYRVDGNDILITSTAKGKRIRLGISGYVKPEGTVTVVLKNGNTEIHFAKDVKSAKHDFRTKEIGIDKGYTSLVATSNNTEYGTDLGKMLTSESERLTEKNRRRNPYYAMLRDETVSEEKKENIRKNNIGKKKYNRKKHASKEKIKSYINHSLYEMMKEEDPEVIYKEKLDFTSWRKKLPKEVKRKLSSWTKRTIDDRIVFIAEKQGRKLVDVNPSYTSQICSICGRLGIRSGKTFTCETCGTMDADRNAAVNILRRGKDEEITLYTPYKKVRELLLRRSQSV